MDTTEQKSEISEQVLDDLHDALRRVVRYYEGMLEELAKNTYTLDTARQDYDMLMTSEDNIVEILKDAVTAHRSAQEALQA